MSPQFRTSVRLAKGVSMDIPGTRVTRRSINATWPGTIIRQTFSLLGRAIVAPTRSGAGRAIVVAIGMLVVAMGFNVVPNVPGRFQSYADIVGERVSAISPQRAPAELSRALPEVASLLPPMNVLCVGNTNGAGVNIRRAPSMDSGTVIRPWREGALMLDVGGDQQSDGMAWKQVRDSDVNVGWVAAPYLIEDCRVTSQTGTR